MAQKRRPGNGREIDIQVCRRRGSVIFAVISDIHANLEALEAVLEDLRSQHIDTVYCLGDVVGYGCDPTRCLELVVEHCDIRLMGNHEYYALGLISNDYLSPVARQSAAWTQEHLTEEDIETISNFEMEAHLADIHLVHASPFEPESWRYILATQEAQRAFDCMQGTICFYGHSHLPMIFSCSTEGEIRHQVGHDFQPSDDKRYLVNVGSVGQPRDNDPKACYALFDADARTVTYRRVAYDIEKTQQKMKAAGVPELLVERLTVGQ
ncbi:metallophosphoesterase [candidate division GN15 bacterium]|nr:metallophosphoesterase [candidate division GN15 bacterium]